MNYIPSNKFTWITLTIVVVGLMIGLLIPSVELVIGLVGSTIVVAICIMFPSSCFYKVSKKDSFEKMLAQFILFFGFTLMILGTYANLNAIDAKQSGSHLVEIEKLAIPPPTIAVPDHIEPQLKIDLEPVPKIKDDLEPIKVTEKSIISNVVEVQIPDIKEKEIIQEVLEVVQKPVEKKDEIDKKAIEKEENEINKDQNEKVEEAEKEKEKITDEIKKLKETKIQLEKEVQDIKKEVSKQAFEVNKKTDADEANHNLNKEADPVVQLLSSENQLDPRKNLYILQNDNKLNKAESNLNESAAAEIPLSYKIGEMVEQNKTILRKLIPPIPIVVLSNSNNNSNKIAQIAPTLVLAPEKPTPLAAIKDEPPPPQPEKPDDNKLIDSIRRDLLELNTKNDDNSTPLDVKREKRDVDCDKPDEPLAVDSKFLIESNIKLISRDLKSVDENKKK